MLVSKGETFGAGPRRHTPGRQVSRGERKRLGHGVEGRRNSHPPRWKRLGSKGQARPLVDGVWGERSLLMALNWLDAGDAPQAGGIQRGRAAGPLGK